MKVNSLLCADNQDADIVTGVSCSGTLFKEQLIRPIVECDEGRDLVGGYLLV